MSSLIKLPLLCYRTCHMFNKVKILSASVNIIGKFYESIRYNGSIVNVFDRKAKRLQKDWSACHPGGHVYDYLKTEVGDRVADRVYDIMKEFPVCVELGCSKGHVANFLNAESIGMLFQCDLSSKMVEVSKVAPDMKTFKIIVDDEYLPFASNSVDLFLSNLNFHWINDLPSTFEQIHDALKPDGVLIASMFGGDTLFELRSSFQLAETEREGGFSPHISPFVRIRDIGDLLTTAGYSMLTIDVDEIKVNYPTMFELFDDLRGMSETNVAWNRKLHIHRDSMLAAATIYAETFGNPDKTIPATFEIIYLIGWKPHESQAKPAKRGSGKISMKSISDLESKLR